MRPAAALILASAFLAMVPGPPETQAGPRPSLWCCRGRSRIGRPTGRSAVRRCGSAGSSSGRHPGRPGVSGRDDAEGRRRRPHQGRLPFAGSRRPATPSSRSRSLTRATWPSRLRRSRWPSSTSIAGMDDRPSLGVIMLERGLEYKGLGSSLPRVSPRRTSRSSFRRAMRSRSPTRSISCRARSMGGPTRMGGFAFRAA